MYGYKARIGLIIPSLNNVIEPEFNAMKPDGVSIHATRVLLTEGTLDGEKKMLEGTEDAAKLIASAGVDIIAYACTSGSLLKGVGWDQELIGTIERITGIPATTTTTAVMRVFKEFRVNQVAVATPYPKELNQLEKEFFEAHGIRVMKMKGLGLTNVTDVLPETVYELACEVDTPEAEAVFISCTGLKTITVIEKLEADLHKHVFSSNTATLWDVLKRLGIREQIQGCGKLLATL